MAEANDLSILNHSLCMLFNFRNLEIHTPTSAQLSIISGYKTGNNLFILFQKDSKQIHFSDNENLFYA